MNIIKGSSTQSQMAKKGRNILNVIPQTKDLATQILESNATQEEKSMLIDKLTKLGALSQQKMIEMDKMDTANRKLRLTDEYKNKVKVKARIKQVTALIDKESHEFIGAVEAISLKTPLKLLQ